MVSILHSLPVATIATAPWDSPYIVPVSGCAMCLGIVIAGVWAGVRSGEVKSQERLAAIAQGIAPPPDPEVEMMLAKARIPADPRRTFENLRRSGIILISCGLGLIVFFALLAAIFQARGLLAAMVSGVLPLFIGAGLLIDARLKYKALVADGIIDAATGAVVRRSAAAQSDV